MRKKFIGAFLLGLLALGTAGTITSCKDYDGDISSLKNDLSSLNSTLTQKLTDLQNQLTAQKAEILTKLTEAENSLYAAIDKKADKTTVDALTTRVSSLETELATVNSRLSTIESDINTINGILATKADKTELEAAKANLEQQLADAKATLQAAIDQKADKTVTDALQDQVDALKERVSAIETTLAKAVEDIAADKADLAAYKLVVAADIARIDGDITEIKAAIEALKDADTALAQSILDEVAARTTGDENLQAAINQAVADQAVINADVAQKIADLMTADAQLQEQINNLVLADQALQASLDETNAKVASNYAELSDKIASLKATVEANMTKVEGQIADIYATMATKAELASSLTALETSLQEQMQAADDALKAFLQEEIDVVSANVNTLNFLVTKRLTSIYFMPNTYINGVEAINFNTLQYKDWYSQSDPSEYDLQSDVPSGKTNSISDNETEVQYYLNPSGTSLDAIESFSFISNDATNILLSRAGSDEAPIKVASVESLENGKLTLKLAKTTTESLKARIALTNDGYEFVNGIGSAFQIVSLKATLANSVKTAQEKAAGTEVNVYSDWARLTETVVVPYIHDTRAYDFAAKEITSEETNGEAYQKQPSAHFYKFSDIYYNEVSPLHYKYAYDDNHIALQVPFNKEFDLDSLMMVCDKTGREVAYQDYGLTFEYNAMEYNVLNENQTDDATDQAKYIKMSGDRNHIIKAKTSEGLDNNRDAIGKTPVIQVILRDSKNNAVVDVRYFRVEWTDVPQTPNVETRDSYAQATAFECGEIYGLRIGEEYLNAKLYAVEGASGKTAKEFHAEFTLDSNVYATAEAAAAADATQVLGEADDLYNGQESTQANNIQISWSKVTVPLTKEIYDGTPYVLSGYIAYRNATGLEVRIIPVYLTLSYKGPYLSTVFNYNETYWANAPYETSNINKYVVANPTLTTDPVYGLNKSYTDAQILDDLRNNYIKDGKVPATVSDLLKNSDATRLVFDEERIKNEQSTLMPYGSGWTVASNGYTLKHGTQIAAEIDPTTGIVQLYEGTNPGKCLGTSTRPTDAALSLVNYDYDVNLTPTADTKNVVPVKLVGKVCDLDIVMDQYLVRFEQPLYFQKSDAVAEVMDQIDYTTVNGKQEAGSVDTKNIINNQITISEVFGLKRTVWGKNRVTSPNLADWYIVDQLVAGTALINVSKNGKILDNPTTKITDLVDAQGTKLYDLNVISDAKGNWYVQFKNNSGNALTEDLKAIIPVTINTKWRKGISYNVAVTIKQYRSGGADGLAK